MTRRLRRSRPPAVRRRMRVLLGSRIILQPAAMGAPEIAFAGRSNVGKSSLLNALTNRNTLARTSNTPGRTQQLNFFALGGPPGEETPAPRRHARLRLCGQVAKNKIEAWNRMMRSYLRGRATLMRVYILIDARHGLKPPDLGNARHARPVRRSPTRSF